MSRTNVLSPEFRMHCTSCGKMFKPKNLLDKVVHSVLSDNFYLIRVCKKCFDLNHIVCKYGKRELEPKEVGWICNCGQKCESAEEVENHTKSNGHNNGHLFLIPKKTIEKVGLTIRSL